MVANSGTEVGISLGTLFECLARSDRRRCLAILYAQAPDSVPESELATTVSRWKRDEFGDSVSDTEHERVLVRLRHAHLPKFAEAGLIERDENASVRLNSNQRAFDDPGIIKAIEEWDSPSAESLDALFRSLVHGRRRTILDILSHQFGRIHTETLARELVARQDDGAESAVPEEIVNRILLKLYHKHLPRLAKAELIEYDADAETVEYRGHPELRVPWMHSVLEPDFRRSVTGETEIQEVGTIEGREQVVSFGQSLIERTDEELFCMFTDVDLLEAGCLTRIRDASRRGADVYLGTCDPTVSEYVKENAPEVTLWEPNKSWLDLPVAGNRVGRLLLCDREALMLGTFRGATTDGLPEERAIVGEGADNTLVVMVTQLLRPYLEQIDDEPAETMTNLPF